MPAPEKPPPFLEAVAGPAASAAALATVDFEATEAENDAGGRGNKAPEQRTGTRKNNEVGRKDLGIGEPTSAAAVTSADMVKQ